MLIPPNSSYNISGTVYKINGSTLVSGVIITAYNATKQEWLLGGGQGTSASDGSFVINAGNFPTQWSNNDVIFLICKGTGEAADYRFLLDAGVGTTQQNARMKSYESLTEFNRMKGGWVANDQASADNCDFYDIKNDIPHRIKIGADATEVLGNIDPGLWADEGWAIIVGTDANNGWFFGLNRDDKSRSGG